MRSTEKHDIQLQWAWINEPDGYRANGRQYTLFLLRDENTPINKPSEWWTVQVIDTVGATRHDDAYEIVVEERVFADLYAAKYWAESVDLRAHADYLAATADVLNQDTLQERESQYELHR